MTASAQKRLAELTSTSIENLNDTDLLWYAISVPASTHFPVAL